LAIIRRLPRLHVRAVIDELLDRNLRSKLRQPAEVVAVPVRDDQVIDLLELRILDRRHNAPGIAHRAWRHVAGVHQQRFARRRHKEHRIPALHVDDIHIQPLPRLRRRIRGAQRQHRHHHDRAPNRIHRFTHAHLPFASESQFDNVLQGRLLDRLLDEVVLCRFRVHDGLAEGTTLRSNRWLRRVARSVPWL
jgi:hypothetical protein